MIEEKLVKEKRLEIEDRGTIQKSLERGRVDYGKGFKEIRFRRKYG